MGKPRLIIIIRHAQSEGNKDKTIHQTTPDHRVGLTADGHQQAQEAEGPVKPPKVSCLRFVRMSQFLLLFQRSRIKVYEEPRLREQDFGNFQPNLEETERLWRERADYGHFFYRIPNGESGADVYDRVSSFNGSLWRRFSEDSMASVAILVTHGLCSRVFMMARYHYSVEFFEDLRNINPCEFLVMKLAKNGRYVLQNQLRRWSDLRKERAQRRSVVNASPEIPVRRWGSSRSQQELAGVTLGDPAQPQRQNTSDLFRDDDEPTHDSNMLRHQSLKSRHKMTSSPPPLERSNSTLSSKLRTVTTQDNLFEPASASGEDEEDDHDDDDKLRVMSRGRDGGGSTSGFVSPHKASDDEHIESDNLHKDITPTSERNNASLSRQTQMQFQPRSLAAALRGELDESERVMADALGDQSDADVDELDLEIGTKEKERKEMAYILREERLDRLKHRSGYE